MASNTKFHQATFEDCFSDDGYDNGVFIEPSALEPLLGKANVRAKRSTPERSNRRNMPSVRYHSNTPPPPKVHRRPPRIGYCDEQQQMHYEEDKSFSDLSSGSESESDSQPRPAQPHELNPLKIKRQPNPVPLASSIQSHSAYDTPRARVIVEGSRSSRRYSRQTYHTLSGANHNRLSYTSEAHDGSEKEEEAEANDEIRLRIGNDAPVTLSLNGDMEGRTLQLLPSANGMDELVISNTRGHEVPYQRERGVLRGTRRDLESALQARQAAQEVSEKTSNSSRRRRGVNKDTGAKRILLARESRTIVIQDPTRTSSRPAESAVEQGERGITIEPIGLQMEVLHIARSKAPGDVDKHHLGADLDPLEQPLIGLDPAKMRDLELEDQEVNPSIMLAAANDPLVQQVNDSLRGDKTAHRALEDIIKQIPGTVEVGHLHHYAIEETASIPTILQEADDPQDRGEVVESSEDSHNKEIQSKSLPKIQTERMSDTGKSSNVQRASDSPESRPLLFKRQPSPDRLTSCVTEETKKNDHDRLDTSSKGQRMPTPSLQHQTHYLFDQPPVHSVPPLIASQATLPPGKPKLDDAELKTYTQKKHTANDRPMQPDYLLGVDESELWVNYRPRGLDDDAVSIGSSYATSVFSIASLASDATDLSRASGYSRIQIATATRELVSVFEEDSSFVVLYQIALNHPTIGPERLQRNLRRLFKVYAECLQEEAKDQLEFLASRLVSLKARHLARSIVAKYHAKVCYDDQRDESSDNEQTKERPVDENVFEDLVSFREFLMGSKAFEKLRSQLKSFVSPKEPELLLVEPPAQATTSCHNRLQKTQLADAMTPERSWQAWSGDARRVLDDFFMDPKDLLFVKRALFLVIDTFYLATDGLSICFGLLEPPLVQNATRLRWKTKCGDRIFSDVVECRDGGVAQLMPHLERSSATKVTAATYNHQTGNQQYIAPRPVQWLRNGFSKLSTGAGTSARAGACIPLHNIPGSAAATAAPNNPHVPRSILHLMACMHRNRSRKVLQQDAMENVRTDRQLLKFMNKQYIQHRGRVRNMLSLKSVQGIFLVKFNLPIGSTVIVRDHASYCAASGAVSVGCECIPPPAMVEPALNAQYRCIPGPPATYPPIPSDHLVTLFLHPSYADETDDWILQQPPKRICGRLQGQAGQPAEGWGVYYQEGWDRDLITVMVFVVFLVASVLFGALWSVYKFDIQGAFGISAYMVAVCAALIPLIAMLADKPR